MDLRYRIEGLGVVRDFKYYHSKEDPNVKNQMDHARQTRSIRWFSGVGVYGLFSILWVTVGYELYYHT